MTDNQSPASAALDALNEVTGRTYTVKPFIWFHIFKIMFCVFKITSVEKDPPTKQTRA